MSINGQNHCCCGCDGMDPRMEKVKTILEENSDVKGSLIPVLHEIQEIFGYLPEEALNEVSKKLGVPMTEIFGVATFYQFFSLNPKGEHIIKVCLGTACYVKGSQTILDRLCQELNIKVGGTTEDGKFTLEATRCLGACGLSPVITVDEKVYGRVTMDDVIRILNEYMDHDENFGSFDSSERVGN